MKNDTVKRTKAELVSEIEEMRRRIADLELSRSGDPGGNEIVCSEILQSSPIPMFAVDRNHRIFYWNRAMENLSGYKTEEMNGTDSQWRIFYNKKRPLLADLLIDEAIKRGRAGLTDFDVWYRVGYKRSSLLPEAFEATDFFPKLGRAGKWLRMTAALVRSGDGKIVGALETFEDMTERVEAEKLNRTMVESSPIAIYLSRNGRFVYVNAQFENFTGYSAKELTGRKTLELVHPDDREQVSENAVRMLNGERTLPYEFRSITKSGAVRRIMETVSSIEYEGKRGMLGNYMDVTGLKEAQDKIRDLRDLETSILEAIPIAVIGLQNRVINFANNAVRPVFGWRPEDLIGKSTRVLYRSDREFEKIAQDFYPVLEQERVFFEEFPCRRKDGKEIICLVTASRIGEYLKNRSIVATYEDITERKKAEADLKKSFARLQRSMEDTIQTIAMIVETRDPYTAGHQRRVDLLACAIAREMGLPQERIEGIHTASVIHDIGKIYIPAEMLSKPGHLTEIEYDIMKTHPQVSYDILKRIEFPWPVANIVYQHHERFNGSGYPRGLKGEEILLEARILAVADVFESMASHRPYRPTVGTDKAIEEISKNRGILYDPDVADACLGVLAKGFKFE